MRAHTHTHTILKAQQLLTQQSSLSFSKDKEESFLKGLSIHPLPAETQGGAELTNITTLSKHEALLTNQVRSLKQRPKEIAGQKCPAVDRENMTVNTKQGSL